jgi:hypothetical protein
MQPDWMAGVQIVDGMMRAQDDGEMFSYVYNMFDGRVKLVAYFEHGADEVVTTKWFV